MGQRSLDFKVIAALLGLALALGGAGLAHPLLGLLLRLATLAAAAYLVGTRRVWRFDRLPTAALIVLGLVMLLPLLQLVPLPPSVWQHLPGRELPTELHSLLGVTQWRPLTLDVGGTLSAYLSLLPAAVLFVGCLFLPVRDRVQLFWLILAFGLLGAVLGIVQFATGGRLTPFPSGHSGYAIGLFVNRNHSASLSLVAMPIAAALGTLQASREERRVPSLIGIISALVVLAIAVLATTSRMALLLLPFVTITALFLTFYKQPPWRVALPAVICIVALGVILFAAGGFDRTFGRFSSINDPRFNYWEDIQWAFQHYGMAGTGFGTFVPVYQSAESLDAVVPAITNHAHNEYLEIILEGGFPAILIALGFVGVLGMALWRSARARRSREAGVVTVAATCGIVVLLLCSVVDYPLRMPALSAVFAVLFSTLLPNPGFVHSSRRNLVAYEQTEVRHRRRRSAGPRLLGLLPLALLAFIVVQDAMSTRELLRGRLEAAVDWASWSTTAHERLATRRLLDNRLPEAREQALRALALSPISAPAIRTIGSVHLANGERASGDRLMQLAVVLGWRDALTQLWAIQRAESSGELDKAFQRAEALFQQNRAMLPAIIELLYAPDPRPMVSRLAASLAKRPPWREAFFRAAAGLPVAQIPAFERLVTELVRMNAAPTAKELQPLLSRLVQSHDARQAQDIWSAARGHQLIANGEFELVGERLNMPVPAGWDIPSDARGRVNLAVNSAAGGYALRMTRPGSAGILLSQDLLLSPGDYALKYRARAEGAPAVEVRWDLRCSDSRERATSRVRLSGDRSWHSIEAIVAVPERDCPMQTLALRLITGNPNAEIWLDGVELHQLAR